jgi:glycosyltransferase involved in cell wall biosynthesis
LTLSTGAYGQRPTDYDLLRQVPDGTVIERVGVYNPKSALSRIGMRRRQQQGSGAVRSGRARILENSSTGAARQLTRLLFETPDAEIGWVVPAVLAARRMVREYHPRLVYSTGPPHSSHLAAVVIKAMSRLPLVLDFRDPWARKAWGGDFKLRSVIQERLEGLCVRNADHVILNTAQLQRDFLTTYSQEPPDKFTLLPNGYDPELRPRIDEFLQRQTNSTTMPVLRLCHPGAVYGERDLRPLVDALARLVSAGVAIELDQAGRLSSIQAEQLGAFLRERDLSDRVRLHGHLSHEKTLEHMAAANVLIVIQPGTSDQIPGKLYEMLMFRKPIVALSDEGATADVIREFDLGVVVPPTDPEQIAHAILATSGRRRSAAWDRAIDAFDGRRLAGKLARTLDRTCRPEDSPVAHRSRRFRSDASNKSSSMDSHNPTPVNGSRDDHSS